MTILLVRHGETDGNAARILQRADVPLDQRGMRQADQLATRLSAHGFVHTAFLVPGTKQPRSAQPEVSGSDPWVR